MSATAANETISAGGMGGEKLRLQMLRATRGLFSKSAAAVVAIGIRK